MAIQNNRPFNIFVPNLLNICIDENENEELGGRLYHCYSYEPIMFSNVIELIRKAEELFDRMSYPQASTKTRSFIDTAPVHMSKLPDKVVNQEELLEHKGKKGSFVTSVRFRQNSTWQGDFKCLETGEVESFKDVLEFVKKMVQKMK